jgi:hypothetical protein
MRLGDNQYKYGSANLHTHPVSVKQSAELLNVSPRIIRSVKAVERVALFIAPKKITVSQLRHPQFRCIN